MPNVTSCIRLRNVTMKCMFGTLGGQNAIGKPKEENLGPN